MATIPEIDIFISYKILNLLPGRHITTQSGTKTAFHDQEITWSNFKATKINNNTLDDNIASISRLRSFLNPQTQAATAHGQRKNRGINVNIHLWVYTGAIST